MSKAEAMRYDDEAEFWKQWPDCIAAILELHEGMFVLPDYRYELVYGQLEAVRHNASINEIEKALRLFWDFDGRFFGEPPPFWDTDYAWAVYSLCYLGKDERVIKALLRVYPPLLGGFVRYTLGENFQVKVGSTFMNDVGHYLWELQGLIEPEDHALFDWHGNRNDFRSDEIKGLLELAGLPSLANPDFPPRHVFLHFTNLQDPFESDTTYRSDLAAFYREKGYTIATDERL